MRLVLSVNRCFVPLVSLVVRVESPFEQDSLQRVLRRTITARLHEVLPELLP